MTNTTPTEAQEQATLFEWAAYAAKKHPELALMFHIPNEGKRSGRTGAGLIRQGLKRGVPDVFLPVARGGKHGLFIEMKRVKGGTVSQEQREWREKLRAQGYAAEICFGWEAAAAVIRKYLDTKPES